MSDEPRKLIKGVTLNLGGDDYVVPPLNLEQLEEHAEIIDKLAGPLSAKEQRPLQVTLIKAALSRNYPEITAEQLRKLLDLGNLLETYLAVMAMSGFEPVGEPQPGEG
jgi:hypothetical protein